MYKNSHLEPFLDREVLCVFSASLPVGSSLAENSFWLASFASLHL